MDSGGDFGGASGGASGGVSGFVSRVDFSTFTLLSDLSASLTFSGFFFGDLHFDFSSFSFVAPLFSLLISLTAGEVNKFSLTS